MSLANTPQSYGAVARTLHWLTALLILTAIPLGLIASDLPYDTADALAQKAQTFSLHKTVGVAALAVAALRILWALTQTRPAPIHPGRRWETRLAELVHWALYIALVAVPLSGWIEHAATTGLAPILWPLGQDLPFIPKSEALAHAMAGVHEVFGKVLIAAILLHVAGALKHALLDRDGTLARMARGTPAPANPAPARHGRGPALAAAAIYLAGAGAVVALGGVETAPANPAPAVAAAPATGADAWQVDSGSIEFVLRQMGASVRGRFGAFSAEIRFDPGTGTGDTTVTMDVTSLSVGSVTAQAREAEYFDVAGHPAATYAGAIRPEGKGFVVDGMLTLKGKQLPVVLPFSLAIEGNKATATGTVTLDRRDFGIGAGQSDEDTLGFDVKVEIALTATRLAG
jgi:cytochrome b561/polyisoprenoid-binding protein YceI